MGGAGWLACHPARAPRLAAIQHPPSPRPCLCRHLLAEQEAAAEQQERADLAAAQAHFEMLGWPAADLAPAPGDEASPASDGLLSALLCRVVALQEARQRGKEAGVDWEAPQWK